MVITEVMGCLNVLGLMGSPICQGEDVIQDELPTCPFFLLHVHYLIVTITLDVDLADVFVTLVDLEDVHGSDRYTKVSGLVALLEFPGPLWVLLCPREGFGYLSHLRSA